MLPGTADGMKHVCVFRHALALDERRIKFLPEYLNEGVYFCESDDKKNNTSAVHGTGPSEKKSIWEIIVRLTEGLSRAVLTSGGTSAGHIQPQILELAKRPLITLRCAIDTKTELPTSKPRLIHAKEVWFAGTHSDM